MQQVKKYRKKPTVIEAIQYTGMGSYYEVSMFCGAALFPYFLDPGEDAIHIETLEGRMKCSKGDYIIKGIKGEFYPCKPDIFEALHEVVEE